MITCAHVDMLISSPSQIDLFQMDLWSFVDRNSIFKSCPDSHGGHDRS